MTKPQKTSAGPSIVWFRNDLRIADNPALHAAQTRGAPILCIFVLEADNGLRPLGAASRWWLHHSLAALAADLDKAGARLDFHAARPARSCQRWLMPRKPAPCSSTAATASRPRSSTRWSRRPWPRTPAKSRRSTGACCTSPGKSRPRPAAPTAFIHRTGRRRRPSAIPATPCPTRASSTAPDPCPVARSPRR